MIDSFVKLDEINNIVLEFNGIESLNSFFQKFDNRSKCLYDKTKNCNLKTYAYDEKLDCLTVCIRKYNCRVNEIIRKYCQNFYSNINWSATSYFSIPENRFIINNVTFDDQNTSLKKNLEDNLNEYLTSSLLIRISELAQKELLIDENVRIIVVLEDSELDRQKIIGPYHENSISTNSLLIEYQQHTLYFKFHIVNDNLDISVIRKYENLTRKVQLNTIINNSLEKLTFGLLFLFKVDHELHQMVYHIVHFGYGVSNFGINVGLNKTSILKIEESKIIQELNTIIKYHYFFLALKEQKLRLEEKNLKTAIISILVDSFAHNISAHSLNAIIWIYLKRLEQLNHRIRVDNNDLSIQVLYSGKNGKTCKLISNSELVKSSKEALIDYEKLGKDDSTFNMEYFSLQDVITYADYDIIGRLFDFEPLISDNIKKIPNIPVPLDNELKPFLTYLNEKSAFWNGVTRDISSGGMIITLYDLIYSFADNPLFLGTIAHSEQIHKISIRIGHNNVPREFININLDSLFQSITPPQNNDFLEQNDYLEILNDVDDFIDTFSFKNQINEDLISDKIPESLQRIKRSHREIYDGFLDYLKSKCKSNFYSVTSPPYKFVTLSAEFAELRRELTDNKVFIPGGVIGKHSLFTIFENTLRNVKHVLIEGDLEIKLNIRIEDVPDKPLFKISTWLDHPSKIDKEKIEKTKNERIITEDDKPRLGGTSQDKVCAAMLFNNLFSEVNSSRFYDLDGNKIEWPWINQEVINGCVHRSFYLWQGSLCNSLNNEQLSGDSRKIIENPSRFLFSIFNTDEIISKHLISENGIIRILRIHDIHENANKEEIYAVWNSIWIKHNSPLYLTKNEAASQYQVYPHVIKLVNGYWEYEFLGANGVRLEKKELGIRFAHGEISENSTNILQYRNHGPLVENYVKRGSQLFSNSLIFERSSMGEMIETFLTKIDIYDNRIYVRIKERNKLEILKSLFLNVFSESCIENGKDKEVSFKNYNKSSAINIVIIHLSYIESLNYNETSVDKFVEDYFKDFLNINSKLIITTGRGRGLWWDSLKRNEKLCINILFKPIDSLLAAVQDGLIYKDDYLIKYNLMKVIFGS
ncbi:MAG TPA: hypothetical protein VFF33_13535 [Ignavibacteriaceae bacterium]|nr:hypothetical protein [Ignavibacteriaceae bacterium]